MPRENRDESFLTGWNALPRRERSKIRRMTRLGWTLDDPKEAELGAGYARFQQSRPWNRLFWFWFVPGLALALVIASRIHPVVIGVVLALGVQAILAHRNLRRLARK